MRLESDREMSTAWIIVPIMPYVLFGIVIALIVAAVFSSFPFGGGTGPPTFDPFAFAAAFFGAIAIATIGSIVLGILFAVMIYYLIQRRNSHLGRQAFLYEDWMNMAKELASKKEVDVALSLNNMDRTMRESRFEETGKSAALWAILVVVCFATLPFTFLPLIIGTLYIYYFLMKDFYRHERREDMFVEDLNRTLATAGVSINLPRRTVVIPDRSFILYLLLSIVTIGIFAIYWIYVLLTDPNSHFRQQALIEDTVLAQVAPILA